MYPFVLSRTTQIMLINSNVLSKPHLGKQMIEFSAGVVEWAVRIIHPVRRRSYVEGREEGIRSLYRRQKQHQQKSPLLLSHSDHFRASFASAAVYLTMRVPLKQIAIYMLLGVYVRALGWGGCETSSFIRRRLARSLARSPVTDSRRLAQFGRGTACNLIILLLAACSAESHASRCTLFRSTCHSRTRMRFGPL